VAWANPPAKSAEFFSTFPPRTIKALEERGGMLKSSVKVEGPEHVEKVPDDFKEYQKKDYIKKQKPVFFESRFFLTDTVETCLPSPAEGKFRQSMRRYHNAHDIHSEQQKLLDCNASFMSEVRKRNQPFNKKLCVRQQTKVRKCCHIIGAGWVGAFNKKKRRRKIL
jgi:hypothetical protein